MDELIARPGWMLGRAMVVAFAALGCRPVVPDPPPPPWIAADVAYLASPDLHGRGAGTADDDSAAAYIARQYERLQLVPLFPANCHDVSPCQSSYFQFFSFGGMVGHNVGVLIHGTDPQLSDRFVVVGAHYDHLGQSTFAASDPERGGVTRPGADDNASGTAAVMELGRRFAARPAPRPVLLVHFDAEEEGLVGSRVFVEHPPIPLPSIALMVNLDMVGRLRTGGLTLDVAAAPREVGVLTDSVAHAYGLNVRHSSRTSERSDYASFARTGVPAISFFTGFHPDYHGAGDIAARVDVRGIELIADVVEAVVRRTVSTGPSVPR